MYSFLIADKFSFFSKAFTMEILRHKDIIDELVESGDEIMNTCTEEEKQTMKVGCYNLQMSWGLKKETLPLGYLSFPNQLESIWNNILLPEKWYH